MRNNPCGGGAGVKFCYNIRHEREAGGGFYDIALAPQLDRWPDIAHAALIEMKYDTTAVKCKVE